VLDTLLNPAIVSQCANASDTAMLLSFARGEIARRKLAKREWTWMQAQADRKDTQDYCARAFEIRYALLDETPEQAFDTKELAAIFDFELMQIMRNPSFLL